MRTPEQILESVVKSYNQKESINFVDLRDLEANFKELDLFDSLVEKYNKKEVLNYSDIKQLQDLISPENEFTSVEEMLESLRQQLSTCSNEQLRSDNKINKLHLDNLEEIQKKNLGSYSMVLPFVFRTIDFAFEDQREIIRIVKRAAKNKMTEQADFIEGSNPEDHPNFYFWYSERLIEMIKRFQKVNEKVILNRFLSSKF